MRFDNRNLFCRADGKREPHAAEERAEAPNPDRSGAGTEPRAAANADGTYSVTVRFGGNLNFKAHPLPPQTGDAFPTALLTAFVSLAGIALLPALKRRRA